MATHSSILAWEIPWTEEPSKLHYGFAFRDTLFGGGSVFFLMQAFFQSVIGGLPAFDDGKDELRTRSLTATGEMGV